MLIKGSLPKRVGLVNLVNWLAALAIAGDLKS